MAILERLFRRWGPRRGTDLLDGGAADGGQLDDGDVDNEGLIAVPDVGGDDHVEEFSEDGVSSTGSTRWWLWWFWGLLEHVVTSSP